MNKYFWNYIGRRILIIIFALLVLLVNACSLGPASPYIKTTVDGVTNTAHVTTLKSTITTTPTPAAATMTSSLTVTFTPTATPEPKIPVLIGTPLPTILDVISTENVENLTELACWGKAAILQMEYSQESNVLISLDICGNIFFHDPETLTLLRALHPGGQVLGLQLMPDGKTIATILDGDFHFIDVQSGKTNWILQGVNPRQFIVSPDGSMIALLRPEGYQVINTETGFEIWSMSFPEDFSRYLSRQRPIEFSFSPDGKTFVINPDGSLYIYTVPDFRLVNSLDRTSAYGVSGELIYTSYSDSIFFIEQIWDPRDVISKVNIWDLITDRVRSVYQFPVSDYSYRRTYRTIELSHDENILYVVQNREIIEWNLSDESISNSFIPLANDESKYITQLIEHPDQNSLYLSTSQGDIYIWNLEKMQVGAIFSGEPAEWGEFLVLNSDPAIIFGGLNDSGIYIRSLVDGSLIQTIQTGTKYSALSLYQNLLASLNVDNWGEISIFDVNTGVSIFSLMYNPGRYVNAVFSSDGRRLALSSDDKISILDISSGELLLDWKSLSSVGIHATSFSPDGQLLATGDTSGFNSRDGFIRLWNVQSGEIIKKIQISTDNYTSVADLEWSQNGDLLVSTDNYKNINLIDAKTGKLLYTWNVCPNQELSVFRTFLQKYQVSHCDAPDSVAISPDGKLIAAYETDGYIVLLDVESKQFLKFVDTSFYGDDRAYTQIAFSTDGKYLYSYNSFDGIVRVWGGVPRDESD